MLFKTTLIAVNRFCFLYVRGAIVWRYCGGQARIIVFGAHRPRPKLNASNHPYFTLYVLYSVPPGKVPRHIVYSAYPSIRVMIKISHFLQSFFSCVSGFVEYKKGLEHDLRDDDEAWNRVAYERFEKRSRAVWLTLMGQEDDLSRKITVDIKILTGLQMTGNP